MSTREKLCGRGKPGGCGMMMGRKLGAGQRFAPGNQTSTSFDNFNGVRGEAAV